MHRVLWRYLKMFLRPLRGVPTVIETPVTVGWLIAIAVNATVPPSDDAATKPAFEWARRNRWGLALGTLAVLALLAGLRLAAELEGRARPRLVFTRIVAGDTVQLEATERLIDRQTGTVTPSRTVEKEAFAIRAMVMNSPKGFDPRAAVKNAVIRLRFYVEHDPDQPVWEDSRGLWGNPGIGDMRPTERQDLPANGQEFGIDIAMKFKGQTVLMPWCMAHAGDSRTWPDGLANGSYLVEFMVTGEGLERPFTRWFRIINPPGTADPIPQELHYRKKDRWWSRRKERP